MKRLITPLLIIINLFLIMAVSVPKVRASAVADASFKNCCEDGTCCIQCCVYRWDCAAPGGCGPE